MPNTAPTSLNGTNPSGLNIDLTWTAPPSTSPILLLHFDGTNGSTTFTDSSPTNATMTGTLATIETSTVKFGTGAGSFGGGFAQVNSPTFAALPVLNIGLGDFTYELWVYTSTTTEDIGGVGLYGNNIGVGLGISGGNGYFMYSDTITIHTITGPAVPAATWTHIALVRASGQLTGYVNGVGTAFSGTYSGDFGLTSSSQVALGYQPNASGLGPTFNGFLDEFRLCNFAVYTANFTPPVAPFPSTGNNVLGYDVYRNNASIATYLGSPPAAAYNDVAPIPGTYTYNVATWNGSADDSPLSLPFTITVGGTSGTTPNFLNDELIFGAYFGGKLNLVEFVYLPERTPFLEGATNLIINRYKQEPGDNRQRGVDYTFFLVPGETIQTLAVTGISAQGVPQASTSPPVTPLVVANLLLDPSGLKFAYSVSGGQNGVEYTVQFTTTTQIQTSVVEEIFSINILVEDSFP